MEKNLVAVYGSLRSGMSNHRLLEKANYLGTFDTEPVFSLYALGGYPGIKQNGEISIVMEVYEVDDLESRKVDNLEGYSPTSNDNYFYDRIVIDTPFGKAKTYIYVPEVDESRIVKSGDWKEYVNKITNVIDYEYSN